MVFDWLIAYQVSFLFIIVVHSNFCVFSASASIALFLSRLALHITFYDPYDSGKPKNWLWELGIVLLGGTVITR